MMPASTAGGERAVGDDLRLDYVSPLPPVRSGIADYSFDLLPHLAACCDLRVIRLPGQPVAAAVEERWHPAAASSTGDKGRLPLYQMGNNRHHKEVLELAMERPGVVTLHDLVLHHLLIEMTLAHDDWDGYLERLKADHGWVGECVARARRWGELGNSAIFELYAHRTLVRRQRGVLVHSEWAAGLVRDENEGVEVRTVPMGVPLPPPVDPAAGEEFRRRLGLPADRPLLGSFGFQTPIKRTEKVVAALAHEALADAHLVIAGEVSPALDLAAVAAEAGVEDRVHVTGFLEDYAAFEAAIAACDLAVNLRYPTAGETSASLLRVLAVGKPTVVSDYAQFAELPDEVAVKVPLGEAEVSSLAVAVGELLHDRQRLKSMSQASREYVRQRHDPVLAASEVAAACRQLAALEPPGEASFEAPAPTTLTWRELPGELEVEGADTPWAEGDSRRLHIRLSNHGPARWLATETVPGGVLLEIQWRERPEGEPLERSWLDLPTDLVSGSSRTFDTEIRRPLGAHVLIIEPHVIGVSGFRALGGPRWIERL